VQVEVLSFVEREEVDDLLDELRRVVPARHVQENATIAEAGASSISTAGMPIATDAGGAESVVGVTPLPQTASERTPASSAGGRSCRRV